MPHRTAPSIPARVLGLCPQQKNLVVAPQGIEDKIILGNLSPQTRLRALFAGSVTVVRNPIDTGRFLLRDVTPSCDLRLGH